MVTTPQKKAMQPKLAHYGRGLGTALKETSDVDQVAAKIMKKDSPLMQRARTQGLQQANQRGLLNSSMAVGAAQGEVIDRVLPMASQTAQQRFQAQQSARDSVDRQTEAKQGFGISSALSQQEFGQTKKLSAQDFEQNQALQESEQDFTLEREKRQFGYDDRLQASRIQAEQELARMDDESQVALKTMDNNLRKTLANWEMNQNDRRGAEQMITSMHSQYQDYLRSILSNPNVDGSERQDLLRSAGDLLQVQTDMTEALFGIKIDYTGTAPAGGGSAAKSKAKPAPKPTGVMADKRLIDRAREIQQRRDT